jgi:hypothetical protein
LSEASARVAGNPAATADKLMAGTSRTLPVGG